MTDTTYNGYRNYETWNVALWIGNDEGLYGLARCCHHYKSFVAELREMGVTETPDGVAYNDSGLDLEALEECIQEMCGFTDEANEEESEEEPEDTLTPVDCISTPISVS